MVFSPSDFNGYFPFVCSALPNALLASFSVFRAKFFEFAKKLDPDNAVKLWKERTISAANDVFEAAEVSQVWLLILQRLQSIAASFLAVSKFHSCHEGHCGSKKFPTGGHHIENIIWEA